MNLDASKRKTRARPELSVFEEELNVPFNPKEFLPDVPSHARAQIPSPSSAAVTEPPFDIDTAELLRTNLGQTSDKVRTELRTDLGQTSDKVRTSGGFFELVGLQRQVVLFLHEQSKLARDRVSDPIAITVLATSCGTTVLSAQKTIQRLEGKRLIKRVSFRNGRGGWTRYEISQEVFQEILHLESQDKLRTNLGQSSDKLRSQPRTEPRTSLPSSSSSIDSNQNFKTTTTGEVELFEDGRVQLSPDWDGVDFSPLADVGFSRAHLTQLAKHGKLSSSEVQDSIYFFAFDLRQNGKGRELKGPPLNFFMGILRKGLPYAPPENFESPEAEARRKFLEGKRRLEERRLAEEQELKALAFAEWRRGLSESQAVALVPEPVKDIPRAREASLRLHFDEAVYPGLELARSGEDATERTQVRAAIAEALGEVRG